jgi:CheY-like chemotaxis protein
MTPIVAHEPEARLPRRTIVVVDDDEAVRGTLQDILEAEGYAVAIAANGLEGLALVTRMALEICLVLLDLRMPGMSGRAVYVALKADPRFADIPVVISTSDPARAPDGAAILTKPVSLERLLETVHRYC